MVMGETRNLSPLTDLYILEPEKLEKETDMPFFVDVIYCT